MADRCLPEGKFGADLIHAQAPLLMEEADPAIGFVVDHCGTSIMARRISPMERTSPMRGPSDEKQGGPKTLLPA